MSDTSTGRNPLVDLMIAAVILMPLLGFLITPSTANGATPPRDDVAIAARAANGVDDVITGEPVTAAKPLTMSVEDEVKTLSVSSSKITAHHPKKCTGTFAGKSAIPYKGKTIAYRREWYRSAHNGSACATLQLTHPVKSKKLPMRLKMCAGYCGSGLPTVKEYGSFYKLAGPVELWGVHNICTEVQASVKKAGKWRTAPKQIC